MDQGKSFDAFTRQGVLALLERFRTQNILLAPRVPPGANNHIGDIKGIGVGHVTLNQGAIQTGCTAIALGPPDPGYSLSCGIAILNGFAKPVGVVQLEELGELRGPILLGNTFSIGEMFQAAMRWACRHAPETGRELPTFNPVALECNDGQLNDMQAQALTTSDVEGAIDQAYASRGQNFERGSVGAGRGMTCFGLKGGIGSASRLAHMSNDSWIIAALVLANFGKPLDLTLDGVRLGSWLGDWLASAQPGQDPTAVPEKGSIIMLLATDAPLNCNQLRRLARRAGAGLARTGAYYGHGSGDIAIAVSTAAKKNAPIGDAALDPLFRAAADATEGAIVDALLCATPVKGFRDHYFYDLSYLLDQLAAEFIS